MQETGAMQNIEKDLEFAIEKVLCGTWKERKQMVDRVFTKDAKFWYTLCLASASLIIGTFDVAENVDNCSIPAGISSTTRMGVTTYMEYIRYYHFS